MKKSELFNIKRSMTKVADVIQQLKSLPNCYSCIKSDCPFRLVDDSAPSRYNCPLYERDPERELVENI